MKKWCIAMGCVLCLCAVIFWCGRIYSVNAAHTSEMVTYDVGETVDLEGIEIKCVEAHIFSVDEYKENFNVGSVDVLYPNDKLLCACINVKNTGDTALGWSDVIDGMCQGFQSVTWGSAADPFATQSVNVFTSDDLAPGADQDIWFTTMLSNIAFSRHTWEHLDEEEFYFVPVLEPVQIQMKLDVQK